MTRIATCKNMDSANLLSHATARFSCDDHAGQSLFPTPRTGRRHIQYGRFDEPSEVAQIEQVDPDYHKVTRVRPCRNDRAKNDLPPGRFDVTCRTPKKACSTFDTARVRGCISRMVSSRTLTKDRKKSIVGRSEAASSHARTFRSTSAVDARLGCVAAALSTERGAAHVSPYWQREGDPCCVLLPVTACAVEQRVSRNRALRISLFDLPAQAPGTLRATPRTV